MNERPVHVPAQWYSVRDIPSDRIRRVLSFAELAGACAA
jgi:hypothetical protein